MAGSGDLSGLKLPENVRDSVGDGREAAPPFASVRLSETSDSLCLATISGDPKAAKRIRSKAFKQILEIC
jgi:hypothetical protein